MNDMNLICFLFLARTKNLAKTAKELSISENTVLRNIEKLEDELRMPLFRRDWERVELTAAGERYYEVSLKFESRLKDTIVNMNNPKYKEVLHLAWSTWLGCPQWLKEAILKYSRLHPDLDIRLLCDSTNDIPALFQQREVDVVFSSMQMSRQLCSPNHSVRIEELPLYLAVSKYHLMANEKKASPLFASFTNITVSMGDETEEDAIKRVNDFHVLLDYLPKQVSVYDNWNSVYIDVAMGNGTCITPKNDVLESNDKIVLIPTGRSVTLAASWMYTTASSHVRPFMDFIQMERRMANE